MSLSKQAILIIGPHRSGTSAVAGAIQRLTRANYGSLLMQAQHDNVKGFFENEHIVQLNNDLLDFLHRSWKDPRPIDIELFKSDSL